MQKVITAKQAMTFSEKIRGLMFVHKIEPLYLETRWGIHTCFVREPIMVFILDTAGVVCRKQQVLPWRMVFWNPKCYRILEVPVSHTYAQEIVVGDNVGIKGI